MKKKIFQRFTLVLILALFLSSAIFYIIVNNLILKNTKTDMLSVLKIVDYSLDYEKDLQEQLKKVQEIIERKEFRFTIVGENGIVLADTKVKAPEEMENHLEREEIREAKEFGTGFAKRNSSTLVTSFLYVACTSRQTGYILRVSIPFSGEFQYLLVILPAILLSIGLSLIICSILSRRLADTISKPLGNMARQMEKISVENPSFEVEKYPYEELNTIAEITAKMAQSIQDYLGKIEFERMVRQEFFSNASHELKTPITSIKGYAELLEGGFAKDEKMNQEFLNRIKKEADNMTSLINDILMISRLETKETEVLFSEVRIYPILEDVIHTLKPFADQCGVSVLSDCCPIAIYANEEQIREIFSNLISNGIKYNKPNGLVTITVTKEKEEIIIQVEDTGVGIPKESKERVFERFYRVDKGRSKKMGGTGLGLSIVKHIVNYYNGTIFLESEIGAGSRFTVRIPIGKEKKTKNKSSG